MKAMDRVSTRSTDLIFVTVEFLDSANKPLPVPQSVRAPKLA